MSLVEALNNPTINDSDEDDEDYQPVEAAPKPKSQVKPKSKAKRPSGLSLPPLEDDGITQVNSSPDDRDDEKPTSRSSPSALSPTPPSKRPRLESKPQTKPTSSTTNNIDDIWAQMTAGVIASKPSVVKPTNSSNCDSHLSDWLNSSSDQKDEKPITKALPNLAELEAKPSSTSLSSKQKPPVRNSHLSDWLKPIVPLSEDRTKKALPTLADLGASQKKVPSQTTAIGDKRGAPKVRTGLEGALSLVRGVQSDTLIDKTRQSWQDFKSNDAIHEELEHHKKDRNRYTDKVAFLERSDVREWEFEQKGKKSRR